MPNLADFNIWVNGSPNASGGFEPSIPVKISVDPAKVAIGGSGAALQGDIKLGGGTAPVAANIGIGGGATVQASVAAGFVKPLSATVGLALRALPDLVVRLTEIPKFQIEAPSHMRLGFRIFGFELCAIGLRGRSTIKSQ